MTPSPYAAMLGIAIEPGDEAPVLTMPFADDMLGRPGCLHGGAIAGLLELAAAAALDQVLAGDGRPEPITTTIDFMRGGRDHLTYASARVTRLGNRVANVEATAWQDDPAKPIAAARMTYLIARE